MEEGHRALNFLVVGDPGVGKSSFMQKIKDMKFELPSGGGPIVTIEMVEITDTVVWLETLPYVEGTFFVYDTTRIETLYKLTKWLDIIPNLPKDTKTFMLIGTKCDMEEDRAVSKAVGAEFAAQNNLLFSEVCSTNSQNLYEVFLNSVNDALHKILKAEGKEQEGAAEEVAAQEEPAIPERVLTARERKASAREEKKRVKEEKTAQARNRTAAIKAQEELLGISSTKPNKAKHPKPPKQCVTKQDII